MPHTNTNRRDKKFILLSRLQDHAGEWIDNIPLRKATILAAHYFSLPNHRGGVPETDPDATYHTLDGTAVTWDDVPLSKDHVPADRRTEIYHSVLTGMPGHQAVPEWDTKSTASIYAKPRTPFSKPRDEAVTNQDLLDALAPAAEITLSHARSIGVQIAWWDAMSDGAFSCSMSLAGGVGSGGRLGRPHTIQDVPVNYFRDKLMDWIAVSFDGPEDRKHAARKAICADLTDAEMDEYVLLAERPGTPPTREEMARYILLHGGVVTTMGQAMKVVLMNEAVEDIDATGVDWETPKPMGITRRLNAKEVEGSVITPHWAPLRLEDGIVPDANVDRDCDQVRAMIKTFVSSGDWSAEAFRHALGDNVTRDKFIAFLKKRGTDAAQLRCAPYLLSWEFFNRRQILGLSVADVDFRDDLEALEKRRRDESLSEEQRALVKAHEQEVAGLDEKHRKDVDAMRENRREQKETLVKVHVEQLKDLVEAHRPRRSTRRSRGSEQSLRNESLSEQMRALADAQEKESKALREEEEKELRALHHAQYLEAERMRKAHEEAMKALAEGQSGSSIPKKRVSDGGEGGGTKKGAQHVLSWKCDSGSEPYLGILQWHVRKKKNVGPRKL
ncbi:hypothetical protein QBC34DRAFT_496748 [Podospora aff. communis PSN243]|uniref:DUF7726 domain-containing protein n=1 Tax=Podospora aff. communis PSN243 TaxID=3040156 RepID=A0AAV9GFR4_9PEZI|nr:hypothetical protein QBC34DRAFT_496748 [Podospora aff. communis PSN243]